MTPERIRTRTGPALVSALAIVAGGAMSCAAQDTGSPLPGWLAGCWAAPIANGTVEESWTTPSGGLMMGVNRVIRDGRVTDYEFLLIRAGEGEVVYHAIPSGQSPTDFVATRVDESGFVVENPDHDFPQRIDYVRGDGGGFAARVFGGVADDDPAFALSFGRVPCPEGPEPPGRPD